MEEWAREIGKTFRQATRSWSQTLRLCVLMLMLAIVAGIVITVAIKVEELIVVELEGPAARPVAAQFEHRTRVQETTLANYIG